MSDLSAVLVVVHAGQWAVWIPINICVFPTCVTITCPPNITLQKKHLSDSCWPADVLRFKYLEGVNIQHTWHPRYAEWCSERWCHTGWNWGRHTISEGDILLSDSPHTRVYTDHICMIPDDGMMNILAYTTGLIPEKMSVHHTHDSVCADGVGCADAFQIDTLINVKAFL